MLQYNINQGYFLTYKTVIFHSINTYSANKLIVSFFSTLKNIFPRFFTSLFTSDNLLRMPEINKLSCAFSLSLFHHPKYWLGQLKRCKFPRIQWIFYEIWNIFKLKKWSMIQVHIYSKIKKCSALKKRGAQFRFSFSLFLWNALREIVA